MVLAPIQSRVLLKYSFKLEVTCFCPFGCLFKVDDGRQAGTTLRRGMRYCKEKDAFVFGKNWKDEDDALNEKSNVRMARVCLDAMNAVSNDLQFTTEAPEDFAMSRLPTLDLKSSVGNLEF